MPVAEGTTQAHRRRGQRHRRGRGRPRLPDARTPSRAPSTTAPWIRASTASTRSAGAGIPTDGSAARSRCGCSETRREAHRDRRRDQGDRPGGGARARGARRSRGAARPRRGRPRRERRRPRGAGAGRRDQPPATADARPGPAGDVRRSARRGGAAAGRPRRRGDHRRRLRHAGGARGRRRGARARPLDQLHAHDPVLRGGAGPPARRRRRHAVRARIGRRRSRPQAGRALWRDQGGAGVLPARDWTCAIATPGCAWCWSSRGSSGRA